MKQRLMEDLKKAMKSTDSDRAIRLASVKSVRQAVTDFEKSNPGKEVTEEVFSNLIDKLIKNREKSIKAYNEADRQDLAELEQNEINFIKVYLPKRVDIEEIKEAVISLKEELGADSMRFMGQMMSKLKEQFGTSAKASDISSIVKSLLS